MNNRKKQNIVNIIHGHQSLIEVAHNNRTKDSVEAKEAEMPRMAKQLHHKQTTKETIPQTPFNSTAYFSQFEYSNYEEVYSD